MDWQIMIALVIAVPVILLPVAIVWYLNGAGIYQAFRTAIGKRKSAEEKTPGRLESKAVVRDTR